MQRTYASGRKAAFSLFALAATTVLAACTDTCVNVDEPQGAPVSMTRQRADRLALMATFPHQVTGVTIAHDGRVFVNFPRWSEDAPISVAEVSGDGSLTPYPNRQWNAWRNTRKEMLSPRDHFICVQSVVVDHHNHLWVLDAAAPNNERIVAHGPKLVSIDLATNRVARIISFKESVTPQGTYLNDVRFSHDGLHAFITDSGKGAIIVVDLKTGKARRVLDGAKSTHAEKGVVPIIDGHALGRPDGRPLEGNADGIALSADGRYLYWQALTGRTLYRIATGALTNPKLSPKALAAKVQVVAKTEPADGLWIDKRDYLYVTAPQENAVKLLGEDGRFHIIAQDPRLLWPDTLSEGTDGSVYVTSSHIQDSPWFDSKAGNRMTTELWRIPPAK